MNSYLTFKRGLGIIAGVFLSQLTPGESVSTQGIVVAAPITVTVSPESTLAEPRAQKEKVEIPAAVARAVKDNVPGATIDKVDVEKQDGVTLYDFEFKSGRGEIEVAEDGTVIDIVTIVGIDDIPPPAAEAIQKIAPGARIINIEKSEVRAEVKKGKIVIFTASKYTYQAELVKGSQKGEMQVTADGRVIEAPRWH